MTHIHRHMVIMTVGLMITALVSYALMQVGAHAQCAPMDLNCMNLP